MHQAFGTVNHSAQIGQEPKFATELADQAQQALDEACRLPQGHAEQHFHGKACLDDGIAVGLLSATPACRRGIPAHLGIEPDRQRATALEHFIVDCRLASS